MKFSCTPEELAERIQAMEESQAQWPSETLQDMIEQAREELCAVLAQRARASQACRKAAYYTPTPACDCGALKARTTHSTWCSAK